MDKKTVKDVKDLFNYADALIDEFSKAKAEDGKISTLEAVQALTATLPEGVEAIVGIEKVVDQVKGASDAQKTDLLNDSVAVLIKFVNLFMDKK